MDVLNQSQVQDPNNGYRPFIDRPLRIGYFGLLRDYWSWEVLNTLARQYSLKFEVVLAGLPVNLPNINEHIMDCINISYLGEYRSPDDLSNIYEKIDMIWACYPEIKNDDWNLRWGRPNRFYESCFFKKPCFAREGSLFAQDVKRYNIGFLINDVDVQKVVDQMSTITYNDFIAWYKSISQLPKETYLYTNESRILANEINKLSI